MPKERETDETDWNLCNETWRRIVQRLGSEAKATDFNAKEGVVVLVWTVYGIVGNGGFEYLFSSDVPGDPGYRLSIEAFKTIGCESAARALEDALALFPGGRPPENEAQRAALFGCQAEEKRDSLARSFLDAERDIEGRLAAYIRKHHLLTRGH